MKSLRNSVSSESINIHVCIYIIYVVVCCKQCIQIQDIITTMKCIQFYVSHSDIALMHLNIDFGFLKNFQFKIKNL